MVGGALREAGRGREAERRTTLTTHQTRLQLRRLPVHRYLSHTSQDRSVSWITPSHSLNECAHTVSAPRTDQMRGLSITPSVSSAFSFPAHLLSDTNPLSDTNSLSSSLLRLPSSPSAGSDWGYWSAHSCNNAHINPCVTVLDLWVSDNHTAHWL